MDGNQPVCFFEDDLIFSSRDYSKIQGAYAWKAQRPERCLHCGCGDRCLYAHGRYKRRVLTFREDRLVDIVVWCQRWRCKQCGKATSTGPPGVVDGVNGSASVIAAMFLAYLNCGKRLDNCLPAGIEKFISMRTLSRYIKWIKEQAGKSTSEIRELINRLSEQPAIDEKSARKLALLLNKGIHNRSIT